MPSITLFRVFNRWGQLLYDNEHPEIGWDGTYKGTPQPSDVYFYQIVLSREIGPEESIAFEGEVSLLR